MPERQSLRGSLRSVSSRVMGGFATAVLTLVIVFLVTLVGLSRRTENSRSVERTFAVLRTIESLRSDVSRSELGLTEFILTADRQFLEPLANARQSVPPTIDDLRRKTAGRPEVIAELDELEPQLLAALEVDVAFPRDVPDRETLVDTLKPLLMQSKEALDRSSSVLDRFEVDTSKILEIEQAELARSIKMSSVVVIVGDTLLLALLIAAAGIAIRDAQEKERAVQFQRRVLGMVGHDLRNPLSVVMMSATQIERHAPAGDPRRSATTRIRTAVVRMERMIRDLFDYSRVELHLDLPLERRSADVGTSCARIVEEFRDAHPDREIVYDPGEPSSATWDFERVEQMLENLVGNAIKYSPRGTPVRLSWANRGDDIVIETQNQGPPIPPSVIPFIFEPFRRGNEREHSTAKNSLGLGLYIVRHLVVRHGGKIEARSSQAEGTVFTLRMPREPKTEGSGRGLRQTG